MLGNPINTINGVRISVSEHAYEIVPIFPDKPRTKRRLRRTRGKFGRADRMNPLCYQTPFGLVAHPRIYNRLKHAARPTP